MVRAFELTGGTVVLVSDQGHHETFFPLPFRQGGCPLKLARELEELAARIRAAAHQMGATQER